MKIYTRTGDQGTTSLFSGQRVPKHHERVTAYGELDELNASLGVIAALLPESGTNQAQAIQTQIRHIQGKLFTIGAWLATSPDSAQLQKLEKLSPEDIQGLEHVIDAMAEQLPPLRGFILPGGHVSAAYAQVARSVCRRVERHMTLLMDKVEMADESLSNQYHQMLMYINRLSDYLFILARYCNRINGVSDILWEKWCVNT